MHVQCWKMNVHCVIWCTLTSRGCNFLLELCNSCFSLRRKHTSRPPPHSAAWRSRLRHLGRSTTSAASDSCPVQKWEQCINEMRNTRRKKPAMWPSVLWPLDVASGLKSLWEEQHCMHVIYRWSCWSSSRQGCLETRSNRRWEWLQWVDTKLLWRVYLV